MLGLENHSDVAPLLQRGTHSSKVVSTLTKIVYRCDLGTQFTDLGQVERDHQHAAGRHARLQAHLLGQPRSSQVGVRRVALLDHFRGVADPACMYYVACDTAAQLVGMRTFFERPEKRQCLSAPAVGLELDVDGEDLAPAGGQHVFSGWCSCAQARTRACAWTLEHAVK